MHKTHIWKQRKDVSKVQGQDNDVNFQGTVLYPLTRKEEQRVKTANSIYAFRRNTHWWDKPRSRSAVEDAWYCEQKARETAASLQSIWCLPRIRWEIWDHVILRRVSTQGSLQDNHTRRICQQLSEHQPTSRGWKMFSFQKASYQAQRRNSG